MRTLTLPKSDTPFITFEGGEGAGKSTQIRLLKSHLSARSIDSLTTREPGGTPLGEVVRSLVLSGATIQFGEEADALLMASARRDHMDQKILPALDHGKWVLCDRFFDSTRVYQGVLGQIDPDLIDSLEMIATKKRYPDLTVVLDVPADIAKERVSERAGAQDRFDEAGVTTFEEIREGFREIARNNPNRCTLVDGNRSVDAIQSDIQHVINARFASQIGDERADKGVARG